MQIDSHGVMAMCQWLIRYQRANGYHATIYLSIILVQHCCLPACLLGLATTGRCISACHFCPNSRVFSAKTGSVWEKSDAI